MPAMNGGSVTSATNPSSGAPVCMSPFSGPTNSPFDARTITGWNTNGAPTYANDPLNFSTGAMCTGIGIGCTFVASSEAQMTLSGFSRITNYGNTLPSGDSATGAILTTIGGGKSLATSNGECVTAPYNTQPVLMFGNGAFRDIGAGPVFRGGGTRMLAATFASVANGGMIDPVYPPNLNRSGRTITLGQCTISISTNASPVVN